MRRPTPTRFHRAALACALALGVPTVSADIEALEGARLFSTPERRAALDGALASAPATGTAGGSDVPEVSPASPPKGASTRQGSASADGAPATGSATGSAMGSAMGSATVRSARGTSRIVDGVPERTSAP